ncbi:MAG: hypothetical protein AAGA78_13980, partial [Pseudomonadota bacterium]
MKLNILASVLALSLALPAWAEKAVLLVSIGDYLRLEDNARQHQGLQSLRSQYQSAGYTVYFQPNPAREELVRSFAALEDRVGSLDQVIIHVFGRGAAKHDDLYLLPRDYTGRGQANLALSGISVQMMLDLAGRKPGASAVFLGLEETQVGVPANLARPLSVPDAPGGVFVALAGPKDMADVVERVFLRQGVSLAQAAAAAPVASGGEALASLVLNAAPPEAPSAPSVGIVERTLWRLAQDNPTEANVRAYLD